MRVFIVLFHMRRFHKGAEEVVEHVEFVDKLRKRHYANATVIGDYSRKKLMAPNRSDLPDYAHLEHYVRQRYPDNMAELDHRFGSKVEPVEVPDFKRKTIFDYA